MVAREETVYPVLEGIDDSRVSEDEKQLVPPPTFTSSPRTSTEVDDDSE